MVTVDQLSILSPKYASELAQAVLIRETEERLLTLFSEGKLFGTVHTSIGQELVGVAVARCLGERDVVCSNHRCHGHYIARTDDVEGLIAEVMGKATGISGGVGGSQHLHREGFYSNGVLGGMVPVAAGMALAEARAKNGAIVVVFLGDGAFGEGVVYESLNIASRLHLPLLIVVEDNGYAQSTAQEETLAGSLPARFDAFGIVHQSLSTWNPDELFAGVAKMVGHVRSGNGPGACIVRTYRLAPHSKGDDTRDPVEVQRYRDRDPLNVALTADPGRMRTLVQAARERVAAAVLGAEGDSGPQPEGGFEPPVTAQTVNWRPTDSTAVPLRVVEQIRDALRTALQNDPLAILLGEDVRAPYGGAFKVTAGLSDEFPDRVINMPISEQAIVGIATGLALRGRRAFAEIMFADFTTLCFDQLANHAAKFTRMYGSPLDVPVVVRTAAGAWRGYGPTHSQSMEKHFLGVPGLRVVALNSRLDSRRVYDSVIASGCPTLVYEYKVLYGRRPAAPSAGFVQDETGGPFPWIRVRPRTQRPDLVVVTFGEMLDVAETAVSRLFEEHDILAEILAPTCLYPLDVTPLEGEMGGKPLLVIEEGSAPYGFGAEVLAQLTTRSADLTSGARRLGANESPIPASRAAEEAMLPNVERIIAAALELVRR